MQIFKDSNHLPAFISFQTPVPFHVFLTYCLKRGICVDVFELQLVVIGAGEVWNWVRLCYYGGGLA